MFHHELKPTRSISGNSAFGSKIADMKWKREYKGAKKIQALARGVSTRRNYHLILVERARNYAVLTIQCGIRTHNALRITSKKRIEYSRQCSALTLCRVMRGMLNLCCHIFGMTRLRLSSNRTLFGTIWELNYSTCIPRVSVKKSRNLVVGLP